MYDAALEIVHAIWKNGLTISALGTALYVLLKQRKVKKRMRRYIPWLFADDGDVRDYEARQIRIESKIDYLIERSGGEWNGPGNTSSSTDHQRLKKLLTLSRMVTLQLYIIGRKMKMREYLKKLGRTKFQAFLIATLTNAVMLTGYLLNWEDIQSRVVEWTPAVNIAAQAVATFIYIWAEGKVDKAKIEAAETGGASDDPEYQITDESNK